VQWAAIYGAAMAVGIVGGYLAEARNLHAAFALAACFPLISFTMASLFIHEAPSPGERQAFLETWRAIRAAASAREIWIVAAFVFFFNFSPSFGPAFLYYQTDVLGFTQQFIGTLAALGSVGYIAGAVIYAPLSRRVSLQRLIVWAITGAIVAVLSYLLYRGPTSAVVIEIVFGAVAMITQLAFLDLAAKACPPRVEGTFFALLMSVFNAGMQLSMNVGGRLYDGLGYTPLVLISAAVTALAFLFLPFVDIKAIEERARRQAAAVSVA
jgi:predicted MFS family arabinose efflux permease